jgi:hypothetical protein
MSAGSSKGHGADKMQVEDQIRSKRCGRLGERLYENQLISHHAQHASPRGRTANGTCAWVGNQENPRLPRLQGAQMAVWADAGDMTIGVDWGVGGSYGSRL